MGTRTHLRPAATGARHCFAIGLLAVALAAAILRAEDTAGQPDLSRLSPAAAAALSDFTSGPGAGFEVWVDPRHSAVRRLTGTSTGLFAPIDPGTEDIALELGESFLGGYGDLFGLSDMTGDLVLQDAFDSLGARHVRFRQMIAGIELTYAYLYLHFSLDGRLIGAESTLSTGTPEGAWATSEESALEVVRSHVKATDRLKDSGDVVTPIWFTEPEGGLRAAWKVMTTSGMPPAVFEAYVDAATGELIEARDRACHVTGTGLVFDPDPITVLMDPTLTNMGDACYAQMMAARSSVSLERLDGSGRLDGPWASTSSSSVARANEPTQTFNYCRDTSFFSEVMVYYHIDTQQAWIQSLGFTNVNNRQQVCNPYGLCGAPNAYYDPGTRRITFCRDGLDSSEDAEVIVHEYGHSIQDNQVPGWGQCEEGGAMGEGFGDYLAESRYSGGPGSFQYGETAAWFGSQISTPATAGTGLRSVRTSKVYPRDYRGEVHADGEIWSAALWDIWEQLGRTITDTLVLESHFYLTPGADFMDGGAALITADQNLYAGAHVSVIQGALRARGLYFPQDAFEPNDTQATARPLACGANGPLLISNGDVDWYTFEVRSPGGWLTFYYHGVSPAGSTTCIVPYDVAVFNPSGGGVATQPTGGTNERVDFYGAAPGIYKVRVQGNSGARFAYDLDYVEVNDGSAGFTGMCGDCDGNMFLNILDALLAAQTSAGTAIPAVPERCDVDSSSTVSILDSLILAQYAAGLPVALVCSGGVCGQGTARDIDCGNMVSDSFSVSTAPLGIALDVPGATHFYRLSEIPPSTTSISISLTGSGDIDLVVARPGSIPGSTNGNRYPTSTQMRSTGPTSSESVTLNGGTIYTPADWHGGPLTFAITSFTAGSYNLTVTCN